MNLRRNPRNYESSPLLPRSSHTSPSYLPPPLANLIKHIYSTENNPCQQIIPVVFAVFINLLDAVTFGTCFFPTALGKTSSLAIDLFLFSTLVVQLVLAWMSSFQCGLGTSMAENIPFIHTMALGVYESMKSSHSMDEVSPSSPTSPSLTLPHLTQIMPTILITICLSTILNGLAFYLVGYFKFGYILHFFPRHVILGMTFGFGIFLLLTGFQVPPLASLLSHNAQVTTGIIPDANIVSNVLHMGWNKSVFFRYTDPHPTPLV